ncbi:hypothetical protein SDRG_08552 [Saprolegnia diclina VS20]|uniref:Uncharacterized protein n=1 Tax=Saprolegnia diclina (strain VS20) TaxID=1156394 RepID=T0QGJ9_SAPDV|nr:hypothetical protein SDRG_08552 [Saprolegnia diclina VS20]EQC33871.1 hypothetical protein SDRG_08552 [Saprolegnia diclina VS20]|eukprot:XP_008612666.1 hypothetical protein SDRG_08552 [Saprolegnia diclina VS20]
MHDLKWILNDEDMVHIAPKKTVRFAATAIEASFRVGYNGSAVPSDKVPGVGLHGPAVSTALVAVSDKPSQLMRYNASDRLFFLKRAGFDATQVMHLCIEQTQLQMSRKQAILEEYMARHQNNKRKQELAVAPTSNTAKRICVAH